MITNTLSDAVGLKEAVDQQQLVWWAAVLKDEVFSPVKNEECHHYTACPARNKSSTGDRCWI